MDLNVLIRAKDYIEKLANGINPINNERTNENDIVNDVRITRCLFYVSNILNNMYEKESKKKKKENMIPFYLNKEQLEKYKYNDDTSISKIITKINDLKNNDNMEKLKVVDVCNWLTKIGLLQEEDYEGKMRRIPTKTGLSMGMYLENRKGMNGNYDIVLYSKKMQDFIIDNFDMLLDFINNK